MTEQQEPEIRALKIHLRPFDNPDAEDYYANLTGVATTVDEAVLMFGRLLPSATPPDSGEVDLLPQLRVTVPIRIAINLLRQLEQQLQAHAKIVEEVRGKESEHAGNSRTHQ